MIDTKMVRDNYSRMTDDQLINLAKTEGKDITSEAILILQEEFTNRKLDISVFKSLNDIKIAKRIRDIEKAQESALSEFINSIWNYAFDSKEDGKSNEEIYKGLINKGLDEQQSTLVIKTLESKAIENLDALDTEMLHGGLTCACGFIITVWTYTSSLNGGTYIVAWGAIIHGAIRFFRSMSYTFKYKIIIANIQGEAKVDIVENAETI